MFIVYRHIYDNYVIYVGMGKPGRESDKRNRSTEWRSTIKDSDHLKVEVLWETESRKEAYEKEKEFISLYGRKDLGEGTLLNKTDGGGWLKGAKWTEEKKQAYSDRARQYGTLKKWVEKNGTYNKGRKLPKQKKETIFKRVKSIKEAWKSKTEEEKNKQTTLFINNNPSNKVQTCENCLREIKGASAFKRFHGINCKEKFKYSLI